MTKTVYVLNREGTNLYLGKASSAVPKSFARRFSTWDIATKVLQNIIDWTKDSRWTIQSHTVGANISAE